MSSFKRTFSGLANQHLFHKTDLVVYLEGGKVCYNKAQVYANSYNENTEDIVFWENVFKKILRAKKIKFKSVGSKTTVKEIGLDIINGNIKTVMVAMDSDFDGLLSKKLDHPNVIYSIGYSWENEVWRRDILKKILVDFGATEKDEKDIDKNIKQFIDKISIGVMADGYLFNKGRSFFPRPGHMQCINCQSPDLPSVKTEVINNLLATKNLKKRTLYQFSKRKNIDPLNMCYGHLLADYCFQLISHYLRNRLNLSVIPKDILNRYAINKYFNHFFNNSQNHKYYSTLINGN